jgi:hypothetical protein
MEPTMTMRRETNTHFSKTFLAVMMFMSAYFLSVRVNAQGAADVVQLNENAPALITGTITAASGNIVMIDSGGKPMKIVLDEVELKAPAEDIFTVGTNVSVQGEITGDDFGTTLVEASSITAVTPTPAPAP